MRIEYRNLETATREPETFKTQQAAAMAAGKQAKMWNYLETFYHEQGAEDSGYVTEQYLRGLAEQVPGLNLARWTSERVKPEYTSTIEADAQASNAAGFNGTPSFLIGHTGGAAEAVRIHLARRPRRLQRSDRKATEGLIPACAHGGSGSC